MTYKELKNKIKEEQKALAKQITRGKFLRKLKNQSTQTEEEKKFYGTTTNWIWHNTKSLSSEYRAIHIAYCTFFNNTPMEKIENNTRSGNFFNTHLFNTVYKQWEEIAKDWEVKDEEAVRVSANGS
jgi:hypothetical protein